MLAVGAGDPIRRWPPSQFADLGRRLIEDYDLDVVVVGGAAERAEVERLAASLALHRAAALVDPPLPDLSEKIGRAALLVGLGSGIAHLAATLGVPTVCLLSGVSPLEVWRPIGPRVVNLTGQTACSPCGLKRVEECPFGVACLHAISTDRVMEAVAELLRPAPAFSLVRREPISTGEGERYG